MTLNDVKLKIETAGAPEHVFGIPEPTIADPGQYLKERYRDMARVCHPDAVEPRDKSTASLVMSKLGEWRRACLHKLAAGTYGDMTKLFKEIPYKPSELTVRGRKIGLTGLLANGNFSTIHEATYEGGDPGRFFLKVATSPRNNDIMDREFRTLQAIHAADPVAARETFMAKQRGYTPYPVTSFMVPGPNGAKHRANLLVASPKRSFTLKELREGPLKTGIDPLDAWWIYRRLLLTIWLGHLKGFVHGAVTPDHVLVYPDDHGLVLLDWVCSAKIGMESVPACDPASKDGFLAPEVFKKAKAHPSMDIYSAAATILYAVGADMKSGDIPAAVPIMISGLLLRCLERRPDGRPQDAEIFHNEIGDVLVKVYGNRQFHPMIVP